MLKQSVVIGGNLLLRFPKFNKCLLYYKAESLRVVYYHMVTDKNHSYYFHNKAISPINFRDQIRFLKKHFEIISLNQAIQMAENKSALKKKLVLTFDDGFSENYSVIAPVLVDEKVTATFFLITNCIDNNDLMWRNKLLVINNTKKTLLIESKLNVFYEFFGLRKMEKNENLVSWSENIWEMEKKELYANYL